MAKTAILIPSFERADVLWGNLTSLARQDLPEDLSIWVMDDSWKSNAPTVEVTEEFADRLPIHYVHSGQTKTSDYWRVPGFAFNIGAQFAKDSDYLILCCAEMYHVNETVQLTIKGLETHGKIMCIPTGRREDGATMLPILRSGKTPTMKDYERVRRKLNSHYPYWMGVRTEDYFYIRGYDEDFTGIAADDDDFIRRMKGIGCSTIKTNALVVHMKHSSRRAAGDLGVGTSLRRRHNMKLLHQRRGQLIRNQDREWGKL